MTKRAPRRPRPVGTPNPCPTSSVPVVVPGAPSASLPAAVPPSSAAPSSAAPSIGAQFVELFTAHKWLRWTVFWFGWLWLSPGTIIPGAIAVGVGNVFYKERALNLVTLSAAYLGILAYLLLGNMITDWPEQVRLYMGVGAIFALIVLGKRYPSFGYFLIIMIATAFNSAGRGRRRW